MDGPQRPDTSKGATLFDEWWFVMLANVMPLFDAATVDMVWLLLLLLVVDADCEDELFCLPITKAAPEIDTALFFGVAFAVINDPCLDVSILVPVAR